MPLLVYACSLAATSMGEDGSHPVTLAGGATDPLGKPYFGTTQAYCAGAQQDAVWQDPFESGKETLNLLKTPI